MLGSDRIASSCYLELTRVIAITKTIVDSESDLNI